MVGPSSAPLARQARLLSRTLKLVKKERRITPDEIAAGMGVAKRTYQDFEAGKGDFDLSKIRRFAKATRADAIAIVTMRNKLPMTAWVAFREIWRILGDRLHLIPAAQVLLGMRKMGDDLQTYLDRRKDSTEDWLERTLDKLYDEPLDLDDDE